MDSWNGCSATPCPRRPNSPTSPTRAPSPREFVRALAAHGTTTALVFGSHFAPATAALFEAAKACGLRVVSGLVLSDRFLRPELHQTPEAAYRESTRLIREYHGAARLLYAVTPRFALSASDAMLEVCGALLRENPGVRFQTHLNESLPEVKEVARLFPRDADYLAVYERHGLAGRHSVFAHSVQTTDAELERMAAHEQQRGPLPRQQRRAGQRHLSDAAGTWRAAFTSRSAPMSAAASASAC